MPEFAPDLTEYLAEIGEDKPTKALEDPELLRRSLSSEAPPVLVGKVAQALGGDIDRYLASVEFTAYERGRVMSVLGRKEHAVDLYRQVLESSQDSEVRGFALINMANDVGSPGEREKLLWQAVDEGNAEAVVHLAMFLDKNGNTEAALCLLMDGVRRGVDIAIPVIGQIYCGTKSGERLDAAMTELLIVAEKAGIEDVTVAPFDKVDSQSIARSRETGRCPNLLAHGRAMRGIIGRVLCFTAPEEE